jgi:hypothetical protein
MKQLRAARRRTKRVSLLVARHSRVVVLALVACGVASAAPTNHHPSTKASATALALSRWVSGGGLAMIDSADS